MGKLKEKLGPTECPPAHDDDPFMTLSEVAKYVGKHPATVGRWVADGLIETVPCGPLRKIRRSALIRFLGGTALPQKV